MMPLVLLAVALTLPPHVAMRSTGLAAFRRVESSARVDSIALDLRRFDGRDGEVLVSNGIPLARGALRKESLREFRVLVDGVEQSVHVEALEGRHPDGSLRSVLVEFRYAVPSRGRERGLLILGETRRTPDLEAPGGTRGLPVAVALPSDANYLVTTDISGPTVTSTYSSTAGQPFQRYEQNFARFADDHWRTDGENWEQANYYDRALIYFAFWVRTANPEYFRRGSLLALSYRRQYLERNKYASSPHWAQLEGLEQHYLLTGDDSSRIAIGKVADVLSAFQRVLADPVKGEWLESRIQARVLQAMFLASRLDIGTSRPRSYAVRLDSSLTRVLSTQGADGSYTFPSTCGMSLNYMSGLLNDVLIRIYTYHRQDPRIPDAVKRNADWLWSTQWVPAKASFKYVSGRCSRNNTGVNVGGPEPAPDLNGLFVTTFGWLYAHTGDVTYRRHGDEILAGAVNGSYLKGAKQFNQTYTASFRYLGYRFADPAKSS